MKIKRMFLAILSVYFIVAFAPTNVQARNTIKAWGTMKFSGGLALGINVTGAEIELSCAPRRVIRGIKNKFEFNNVPCDARCQLTIRVNSPTGRGTAVYKSAYKFSKPGFGAGVRGRKAAGYLGDFEFDIARNRIIRNSRY